MVTTVQDRLRSVVSAIVSVLVLIVAVPIMMGLATIQGFRFRWQKAQMALLSCASPSGGQSK